MIAKVIVTVILFHSLLFVMYSSLLTYCGIVFLFSVKKMIAKLIVTVILFHSGDLPSPGPNSTL